VLVVAVAIAAGAVRHVVSAEIKGSLGIGCDDQVLKSALEECVVVDLLSEKNDSGIRDCISGFSLQGSVLLTLAINDRSHRVAFHTDS